MSQCCCVWSLLHPSRTKAEESCNLCRRRRYFICAQDNCRVLFLLDTCPFNRTRHSYCRKENAGPSQEIRKLKEFELTFGLRMTHRENCITKPIVCYALYLRWSVWTRDASRMRERI